LPWFSPCNAAFTKAFEDARKNTMDYGKTTQDDLRDHFGPHPMLGEMDAYLWIGINLFDSPSEYDQSDMRY
jgi:hypothetical protein